MAVKAAQRVGRRAPLSLRTTDAVRDRLEQAASSNGRSLAQEVELRLEQSFQKDELLEAFIGGSTHTQTIIRVLATAVRRAELSTDRRWVDDYLTLWLSRHAINEVLEMVMGSDVLDAPPYKQEEWTPELRKKTEDYARTVAREALRDFGLLMPGPHLGWLRTAFTKNSPPSNAEGDEVDITDRK